MTYILGWKNYDSVFLAGDSVVTIDHLKSDSDKISELKKSLTSFGEQQIFEKERTVSEKWLKLYDLENKMILAISGIVEEAHDGIEKLRMYLKYNSGFEFLEVIENSFRGSEVEVLAGYFEEDVPRLVSFQGKNSRLVEYGFFELANAGSINENFIDQTKSFFSQIELKGWSNKQILASIIAVAQSYGFQEDVISQGVGGFFSGIRIEKDGVKWQPDIMFVPFSYNGTDVISNKLDDIFGEAKRVLIQVRDSVLFSCSPFIENIRHSRKPFFNYHPQQESELFSEKWMAWARIWLREVVQNCDEHKAEFYIFYNTEKPLVGMIFDEWKKPFRISEDTIYFGKDLIAIVEELFFPAR